MTHKYKLYYFPVRGLGERIRYIFAYAGIQYEDVRLDREKFVAEFKPKFPFGQMPVLEIDGKQMLAQSNAIARYLAKEYHLTGTNQWEAALADMYVDGLSDLMSSFTAVGRAKFGGDENAVKEEWAKFKAEPLKQFLDRYEKFLANSATAGHLVGAKITWADLTIAEFLERMESCFDSHVLDSYPKLAEFVKKVHENPGIKQYVSGRPKTTI